MVGEGCLIKNSLEASPEKELLLATFLHGTQLIWTKKNYFFHESVKLKMTPLRTDRETAQETGSKVKDSESGHKDPGEILSEPFLPTLSLSK